MSVQDQPLRFAACDTPQKLFLQRVREWGGEVSMRVKRRGLWQSHSWAEYGDAACTVAAALRAMGVQRGQVVSVLAENRPEWLFFDMGAQLAGAVGNGIYTTSSPAQVAYVLNDSGSRVVLVEDDEQLHKVLAIRKECPQLANIVLLERTGLRHFSDAMVLDWAEFLASGRGAMARDPEFVVSEVHRGAPADVALLVYTSGTTGAPKAAMITNRNLMFQIAHAPEITPMHRGDATLSFLPLCHIAERIFGVYSRLNYGNVVHFPEDPETMLADICEVQPAALFAPPRIWEKMYSRVMLAIQDAAPLARWAFARAIAAGAAAADLRLSARPVPLAKRIERALWRRIVLRNVLQRLGLARMRYAVTGAAPISPDLVRWFVALGIDLREAYGATETSGLCTATPLGQIRLGSVGLPPAGTALRIGAGGEILVRGPHVFAGYRNQPEASAAAVDREGWLHTGDIGELLPDGSLRITDRLKDILITAGGKNVTPSLIENQLKFSPYIADAVVIGDRRPYLTCLVMIDFENVAQFAGGRGVPYSDFLSLCRAPEVVKLIAGEIERVNAGVARVEQIKRFRLIETQLLPEDEELTPTMKLKRTLVNRKYADLIAAMYAGGA
jgi:long-chain acyl-CoA synthetase